MKRIIASLFCTLALIGMGIFFHVDDAVSQSQSETLYEYAKRLIALVDEIEQAIGSGASGDVGVWRP